MKTGFGRFAPVLAGVLAATSASGSALEMHREKFRAASGAVVEAEAGELSVPAAHARPAGGRIRLALVRFPATGKRPGTPIVYLAGGPGSSGIEAARGARFGMFQELREAGDVIALDQRGTGKSLPSLSCSEPYRMPLDRPLDRESAAQALSAGIRECRERLAREGIDPADYTTIESADDLEDLRIALGAPKIRLLAISYGTHLALAALRRNPASIERVVLAGVEPLDHTEKLPSDVDAFLEEVARRAAADPAVRAVLPDLRGAIRRTEDRLARAPWKVALIDPRNGKPVELVLGKLDYQLALWEMLSSEQALPDVPDFVARVDGGDGVALALAAGPRRIGKIPGLMSLAMDCASGADEAWRARIREEANGALLGDAANIPFPEVCAAVGAPDLGSDFRRPVESDVPALLVAGTLDVRTPVSNARGVMAHLPNSRLLVVEDAAHSDPLFLSNPEIVQDVRSFLEGAGLPRVRTISAPPFRFVPPRTLAAIPPDRLARFAGEYRIDGGGVRRVLRAGDLLFTIRDSGRPLAIRPTSDAEFFYEGLGGRVRFETGADGNVTAMVVFQDLGDAGTRAVKVK